MSDDLRAGLVEAMAKALYHAGVPMEDGIRRPRKKAEAALDAALGFLTDNAVRNNEEMQPVVELLAALSDGRDTGENP